MVLLRKIAGGHVPSLGIVIMYALMIKYLALTAGDKYNIHIHTHLYKKLTEIHSSSTSMPDPSAIRPSWVPSVPFWPKLAIIKNSDAMRWTNRKIAFSYNYSISKISASAVSGQTMEGERIGKLSDAPLICIIGIKSG